VFNEWLDGRERAWTRQSTFVRDDGHLVVRTDLPRMKPEEVKIEVEDDILTISGENEERAADKEEDAVRRERRHWSFSRSLALPRDVDAKKVKRRSATASSKPRSRAYPRGGTAGVVPAYRVGGDRMRIAGPGLSSSSHCGCGPRRMDHGRP
jgi:Hsp20/alpha crystallin family